MNGSRHRACGLRARTGGQGNSGLQTIIVGSPKTVTQKLTTTLQQLSPGYPIRIGSDGTIPHKDVMRSITERRA